MLERVQKIISNAGFCSRRQAEVLISQGKVKVNGRLIKLGDKADSGKDRITVGNQELQKKKRIYIMLNKPRGYISTVTDLYGRRKAVDLIPSEERVYHVGRLDRDSSGFLLLTNDGTLANKVMHPRYNVQKTYFVKLDKPISDEVITRIQNGITLSDGFAKARIQKISKRELRMTIHEGRHKIVKRIFHYFNYRVLALKRIAIGRLHLDVKEGKYRFLDEGEIKKVFA